MIDPIGGACQAALAGRPLSRAEAEGVVPHIPFRLQEILGAAGIASSGKETFACGIVNAKSGRCGENCSFCAQSRYHKTDAPVYALVGEEELCTRAARFAEAGVLRMGIVTGGSGPSARDFETICRAARRIVESVGIKVCASLGMLRPGQAQSLREAGVTSYHHNLETGRSFYPEVCTTHSYDLRVETVLQAKKAGLRVCSGGLFGLGESWDQRLELAEALRDLEVDSIPVNFLMPVKGTRLENAERISLPDALGLIAVLRLMHPHQDIVLCGGRGNALGEWDRLAGVTCANGIMVGDYLTTRGTPLDRDMRMLREVREMLHG